MFQSNRIGKTIGARKISKNNHMISTPIDEMLYTIQLTRKLTVKYSSHDMEYLHSLNFQFSTKKKDFRS